MKELYYVWLHESRDLTIAQKKKLLEVLKNPGNIFKASLEDLQEILKKQPCRMGHFYSKDLSLAERILEENTRLGIKTINIGEKEYLPRHKQIKNTPILLYYKGTWPQTEKKVVTLVGSRNFTAYGASVASLACEKYIAENTMVISGLALGIDSIVHEAALSLEGETCAFVANGLDMCYPKENQELSEKIMGKGAVISPFSIGTAPLKHNFYVRNEIMVTWADSVVVIEGGIKSGAVVTGELALKNKRPLYAVPNNIFLQTSAGCNSLLQKGALAFAGDTEIMKKIKSDKRPESQLISLLKEEARSTEVLAFLLKKPINEMEEELFSMEFEDLVRVLPDGKWHFVGW